VEAVTLHDAGEALALGLAGDVDAVARGKRLDGHFLTERVVIRVGGAQLDDVPARCHVRLRVMSGDRLVDLARVNGAERQLYGRVAVGVGTANLSHHARPGLHHGHRDDAVVVPDLGHAELGAQDALDLPVH
jgi:hypothetical protein